MLDQHAQRAEARGIRAEGKAAAVALAAQVLQAAVQRLLTGLLVQQVVWIAGERGRECSAAVGPFQSSKIKPAPC